MISGLPQTFACSATPASPGLGAPAGEGPQTCVATTPEQS
jgi:hypothetical protein